MTRAKEERSKKHQSEARRKALISEFIFDLSSLVPSSFCETQNQVDILKGTLKFLKQNQIYTKMKDQELILLKDELRALRSRVQALESECHDLKAQVSKNSVAPLPEGDPLESYKLISSSKNLPIPTIPISQCRQIPRPFNELKNQTENGSLERSPREIAIAPKQPVIAEISLLEEEKRPANSPEKYSAVSHKERCQNDTISRPIGGRLSRAIVLPGDSDFGAAPIIAIPETLGITVPPPGGTVNNYMIFVSGQTGKKRKSEQRRTAPCPIAPKTSSKPVSGVNDCPEPKSPLKNQNKEAVTDVPRVGAPNEISAETSVSIIPSGSDNLITIAEQEISNDVQSQPQNIPCQKEKLTDVVNPGRRNHKDSNTLNASVESTEERNTQKDGSGPETHIRIDEIVNFTSEKRHIVPQREHSNTEGPPPYHSKAPVIDSLAVSNLVESVSPSLEETIGLRRHPIIAEPRSNSIETVTSSFQKGQESPSKSKSNKSDKYDQNKTDNSTGSGSEASLLRNSLIKDSSVNTEAATSQAFYHELTPLKRGSQFTGPQISRNTDPFWPGKRANESKQGDLRASNLFSVDFLRTDALPSVASVISQKKTSESSAATNSSSAIQKLSHFANSRPKSPVPIMNTQHKPKNSRASAIRAKTSTNESRIVDRTKTQKKQTPTKSSRSVGNHHHQYSVVYPSSSESRHHVRYTGTGVGYGPLVPTEDQSQEVNLSNSIFDMNSFNDPQSYPDAQYLGESGSSSSKSHHWDPNGASHQQSGNAGTFWHHSYGFINAASTTEPTYLYPAFDAGWNQGNEKTSSGFSFHLSNPTENQSSQKSSSQSGISQYSGSFHIANMLPEVGGRPSRSSLQVDTSGSLPKRSKTSNERSRGSTVSRPPEGSYHAIAPAYESPIRSSYSAQQGASNYYSAGNFLAPPPYNFLTGSESASNSDPCQHMPRSSSDTNAKNFMPNFSLRQ